MNMEDFTKIGLLDFQSRGGQNSLFHPQHNSIRMLPNTEFSSFQVSQNAKPSEERASLTSGSSSQQIATSKTWNLDELMSDLSLVYVSGEREGLAGEKLQFCTNKCCSSRVKYASVCKKEEPKLWEKENNIWDVDSTSSTWDIPRQVSMSSRDMFSWDLGSDGASTPGSGYSCWANTQDSLGVVVRPGQQWSGAEYSNIQAGLAVQQQHLLEAQMYDDPEHFDSWAGCDALLGSETTTGVFEGNEETKWNRIKRKSKKTKNSK